MIEIQDLSFHYGSKTILKQVSFSAKAGRFLGILGANGCGKSTLLKNILGFLQYSSGSITIANRDMKSYSAKELSCIMSYIPQKSIISMPLSVKDFILAGRYAKLKRPLLGYDSKDYEIVSSVSDMLNVSQYAHRICSSLSGGEFGRVLLARALVNEPKILLLDEPTSAMDLHYAIEMLKIVKECVNEGMCVVIVIHDLNLASMFCDEIVLMKQGSVIGIGDPANLFTKDNLALVYDGLACDVINYNNKSIVVPVI